MTMTNCVLRKVAFVAATQTLWWTASPRRHKHLASNNSSLRDRETDGRSQQICFLTCTQTCHVSDWVTVTVIYTCKLYPTPFSERRKSDTAPECRFTGQKKVVVLWQWTIEKLNEITAVNYCPRLLPVRKSCGRDGRLFSVGHWLSDFCASNYLENILIYQEQGWRLRV